MGAYQLPWSVRKTAFRLSVSSEVSRPTHTQLVSIGKDIRKIVKKRFTTFHEPGSPAPCINQRDRWAGTRQLAAAGADVSGGIVARLSARRLPGLCLRIQHNLHRTGSSPAIEPIADVPV